jgi:nitrous oxide reductase accessory protein NosL
MRARHATWALAFFLAIACSVEAQSARCEHCGMRVDPAGAFTAGATLDGRTLAFDSNKCLLRYRLDHGSITAAWVTDFYTRAHVPLESAYFVAGGDVSGPMGADFVAVDSRAAAERFMAGHHGTAIHAFAEITPDMIRALFPR